MRGCINPIFPRFLFGQPLLAGNGCFLLGSADRATNHGEDIVHTDCHRGNFLVKDGRACLIDFEHCETLETLKRKDVGKLESSMDEVTSEELGED